MPPEVGKTRGLKLPCSTSRTLSSYTDGASKFHAGDRDYNGLKGGVYSTERNGTEWNGMMD